MKLILMLFIAFNLWAGLPKKAEGDRYFVAAKKSVKKRDYRGAKEYLDKIIKLDVKLSKSGEFHYFYAKSLSGLGYHKEAMDEVKMFLHRSGEKTKYYNEALEVYNFSEKRVLQQDKKSSNYGNHQNYQNTQRVSNRKSNCVNGLCFAEDENVKVSWNDANNYCKNRGKRLPTIGELKRVYLADGGDNKRVPNGFINKFYWSLTGLDSNSAYYFNFFVGDDRWSSKHQSHYVRCINR